MTNDFSSSGMQLQEKHTSSIQSNIELQTQVLPLGEMIQERLEKHMGKAYGWKLTDGSNISAG